VEADLAGGEAVVGAHPQLSWARVSVAALTRAWVPYVSPLFGRWIAVKSGAITAVQSNETWVLACGVMAAFVSIAVVMTRVRAGCDGAAGWSRAAWCGRIA
jgi:hypothetical protein